MTFQWNGQDLDYFDHPYNHTALNSRRVEVPIARWFLAHAPKNARILEVGNVLAHYQKVRWPVVDLREPGAINADIMAWSPPQPIDRLISISTLEHVGFGKYALGPRPSYPRAAWDRLRSFLAPGGQLLATVPLGYNPALDDLLREASLTLTSCWYMRQIGSNEWSECTAEEAFAELPRACAGRWPGGMAILYLEVP